MRRPSPKMTGSVHTSVKTWGRETSNEPEVYEIVRVDSTRQTPVCGSTSTVNDSYLET